MLDQFDPAMIVVVPAGIGWEEPEAHEIEAREVFVKQRYLSSSGGMRVVALTGITR